MPRAFFNVARFNQRSNQNCCLVSIFASIFFFLRPRQTIVSRRFFFSLNKIAFEDSIQFKRPCVFRGFLLCIFCRMRVKRDSSLVLCDDYVPRNMHEGRSKPTIASVMQQFGKTRCANYADFLRPIVRVCVNFRNSWSQCVQLNEAHINGPSAQLRLCCLETLKRPRSMHHRPIGPSDLARI